MPAESGAASQASSNRPQSLEDLPKHSTGSDENTAPSPLKVSWPSCVPVCYSSLAENMQPQLPASRLVYTTPQVWIYSSSSWHDFLPVYLIYSM